MEFNQLGIGKHLVSNLTKGRIELMAKYGYEVVVKCCREWKTHFGDGRFGRCGICKQTPELVKGKKWDE